LTFSLANNNLVLFKVNILNPQADTFHQAQAAAVKEFGHQLVGVR
jgi:hypothetical protein